MSRYWAPLSVSVDDVDLVSLNSFFAVPRGPPVLQVKRINLQQYYVRALEHVSPEFVKQHPAAAKEGFTNILMWFGHEQRPFMFYEHRRTGID